LDPGPCTSCVPGFNQYTMLITNVGGEGSQIARIYINSSVSWGCPGPAPCILNPATPKGASQVAPFTFNFSQSFVNPGEFSHKLVFWLPKSAVNYIFLETDKPGSHSFSIVTTKGQVFSFHYPFPPCCGKGGGAGGTGINIGPLVIKYRPYMITYTTPTTTLPPLPIPGGWQFPKNTAIIFYIQVQSQGLNDVKMVSASVFQIQQFGSPGRVLSFYIIAPMTSTYCSNMKLTISNLDCSSSTGTTGFNNYPQGGQVNLYNFNAPYTIKPNATKPGTCCGDPVYLLFSAEPKGSGGVSTTAGQIKSGTVSGPMATFLNLSFNYDDGTGGGVYTWGVNLPFVSGCAGTFGSSGDCPLG
jgi:hypothetical protein